MTKSVCAWCGADMGERDGRYPEGQPITHGMCLRCVKQALVEPLGSYLDRLGAPVLLVDSSVAVRVANAAARNVLQKRLEDVKDHRAGEVIECVHSRKPGGCGEQIHCKACVIRSTVTDTWKTGRPHLGVKAYPDTQYGEALKTLCISISTEKVGDMVLLRIDDISEGGKPALN